MTDISHVETAAHLLSQVGAQMQTANRALAQALKLVDTSPDLHTRGEIANDPSSECDIGALAALGRKMIRDRRVRDTIFAKPNLFGEPAWEILLDLFVARADGQQISVSSACIGSSAPHTTALRYLKTLEDHALVVRTRHRTDARVVHVTLSDHAMSMMTRYLAQV